MQAKLLISIGKVAFFDVSFTDSGGDLKTPKFP
jgi:hypothetical protein